MVLRAWPQTQVRWASVLAWRQELVLVLWTLWQIRPVPRNQFEPLLGLLWRARQRLHPQQARAWLLLLYLRSPPPLLQARHRRARVVAVVLLGPMVVCTGGKLPLMRAPPKHPLSLVA